MQPENQNLQAAPTLTVWAGLDVGKARFAAALSLERAPGQPPPAVRDLPRAEFARTPAGVREWAKWVKAQLPKLVAGAAPAVRVVMEATGGYSLQLAEWLELEVPAWPAAICEPARVAQYLRGIGLRGKTDPTDAAGLARYGAECWPDPTPALPEPYAKLRALTRERQAVMETRVACANRAATTALGPTCPEVAALQQAQAAHLDRQIAKLDGHLRQHVKDHPKLRRALAHLTTIPGVGFLTAVVFLAEAGGRLPHFATARQFAAWCGLDPVPNQSGTSVTGPAHLSKRGSAHLRRALYLAALCATRRGDYALGRTYARLTDRGKSPLVALGAVMRKLARLMRTLINHDADYLDNLPQPTRKNPAMNP